MGTVSAAVALTSSVDARIIRPQSELDFGVRDRRVVEGLEAMGDVRGHDITFSGIGENEVPGPVGLVQG